MDRNITEAQKRLDFIFALGARLVLRYITTWLSDDDKRLFFQKKESAPYISFEWL